MSDVHSYELQGTEEILGHWVDRIIGWYSSPVVVSRKLYLTKYQCSKWQPNGYDCRYEHVTSFMLPGMSSCDKDFTHQYRGAVQYDIRKKSHFIVVCIIGKIKDLVLEDNTIFYLNQNIW